MENDPLEQRLAMLAWPEVPQGLALRATAALRRRRHNRRLARLTIVVAAIVGATLLIGTPIGSEARSLLPNQWFGIVTGAPPRLTPPPGVHRMTPLPTGLKPPSCSAVPTTYEGPCLQNPDLTLAQVQSRVGFQLTLPSDLPPGLQYTGGLASVHEGTKTAELFYANGRGGHLFLTITQGKPLGGTAVPSSAATSVRVGPQPGVYVKGDYEDNGPGTPAHWNPEADDEEVSWSQNALTYDLEISGMGLSQQQVLSIAASIP